MAFKDKLKTLFQRKGNEDESITTPSLASKEEREELMTQLDGNFSHVGQSLDQLNDHLNTTKSFLADIAATQQELPEFLKQHGAISKQLVDSSAETQAAQQQLLESLAQHLRERDQNQANLAEHLATLAQQLNQQQDHYQNQLNIVMRFHHSGRRMTLLLILILGGLFIGVLALLLAIVLRLPPFDQVLANHHNVGQQTVTALTPETLRQQSLPRSSQAFTTPGSALANQALTTDEEVEVTAATVQTSPQPDTMASPLIPPPPPAMVAEIQPTAPEQNTAAAPTPATVESDTQTEPSAQTTNPEEDDLP